MARGRIDNEERERERDSQKERREKREIALTQLEFRKSVNNTRYRAEAKRTKLDTRLFADFVYDDTIVNLAGQCQHCRLEISG